jgi:putative NIF3 family GTP cyclohydrolase 1 type 2
LEGAKPSIGHEGRTEKVLEIRFETIVPAEKLENVVAAMRKAHPYETPAFDIIKVYNDQSKFGLGRIGKLAKPLRIEQIIRRIKKDTGAEACGLIGKEKRLVKTAAVCAGSCGAIINLVIAAGADLYLTGEGSRPDLYLPEPYRFGTVYIEKIYQTVAKTVKFNDNKDK